MFIILIFFISYVDNITYLDIFIEGKNRETNKAKSKSQLVNQLERIQERLLNSGIREYYIDIISYDAISEYYCNKIFLKLNKLERDLRNLLFHIYVFNFGNNYYESIPNNQLIGKIKQRNQSYKYIKRDNIAGFYKIKSSNVKDIKNIQLSFYFLELEDVQNLLFTKTWTYYDEEKETKFLLSMII